MNNVKEIMDGVIGYAENQYDCLQDVDALIIATEWNEFRTPDFEAMGNMLKNKVIFDGRNLFDLNAMKELGYHYESIGRATVKPE
jgi:UDPglucose 6-dehydrogenase